MWDVERFREDQGGNGSYRGRYRYQRTSENIRLLDAAIQKAANKNPLLLLKMNKGRLCSAVFAELKSGNNFDKLEVIKRYQKIRVDGTKMTGLNGTLIFKVIKRWNEKEFFYCHRWVKIYIHRNVKTPSWVWIFLALIGLLILKKIFKK